MAELKSRTYLSHMTRPSFIQHYSNLLIDQHLDAGLHSDYHNTPGTPGWKSTAFCVESHQTSHCASQHMVMGGYQRNFGSGDNDKQLNFFNEVL